MEIKRYIQDYVNKMKLIQETLLEYIDSCENENESFQKLNQYFEDYKIRENKHLLQDTLHLISKISNNHYRSQNLINKIERILKSIENEIKSNFPNFDIFHIFKNNKRILLFLFEEKIIIPDQSIFYIITKGKYNELHYPIYFYPEFNTFYSEKFCQEIKTNYPEIEKDFKLFESKRKIGENDQKICQYIQNDMIDEFISFVNKSNISLTSKIDASIFETNSFLLKNEHPTLIEYSAFLGSINIFKYLILNKVQLTSYIWKYAIHGKNSEMIHIFEENKIGPLYGNYGNCYNDSIKFHHIELMNYFENNYDKKETKINLKYFNFVDFSNKIDLIDENRLTDLFYSFCCYDYVTIVDFMLNNDEFVSKNSGTSKILNLSFDLNKVQIIFFFYS